MGRLKLTGKLEDKYREFIEQEYPEELEYVCCEREHEESRFKNYRYYITTKCKYCGVLRTSLAIAYKKKTVCKCKDIESLRESAKEYAQVIYNTLAQDKLGLVTGQDLDFYIEACAEYDRPTFCQFKDYMKFLKEEVLELYKINLARECNVCGIVLPYKKMHYKNKNLCKDCCKGMMQK